MFGSVVLGEVISQIFEAWCPHDAKIQQVDLVNNPEEVLFIALDRCRLIVLLAMP